MFDELDFDLSLAKNTLSKANELRDPGGESIALINEYWLDSRLLVVLGKIISS